jgi:hypothetical protein
VFLVRSGAVFVQFSASLRIAQKYVVQHNHNSFSFAVEKSWWVIVL